MASKDKCCEVCGESEKKIIRYGVTGQLLCTKHYKQMRNHGRVFKSRFEDNEIVLHDDYAEIVLYSKMGDEVSRAKISLDKVELVKGRRWGLNQHGYVRSGSKNLFLHHLLCGVDSKVMVDHISGDVLDNRSENLRFASKSQNAMNSKLRSDNKSGRKGVFQDKRNGKWIAYIRIDGKRKHLGSFSDFELAVEVRRSAEQKYFGEFSRREECDK